MMVEGSPVCSHTDARLCLCLLRSALSEDAEADLYGKCAAAGITTISVGHRASVRAIHSNLLELERGGKWRVLRGEACDVSEATADPAPL